MNGAHIIRQATLADVSFLADVIMFAEKSNSNKFGLATLFGLSEAEVKKYLISILREEIYGCEFSISSFLIAELDHQPAAAIGGWIEEWGDEQPSKILKANLIASTFPVESMKVIRSHAELIKDIQIEREKHTLQLEYAYVLPEHRGKNLIQSLMQKHIDNALLKFPALVKCHLQVFGNNDTATKAYGKLGFQIIRKYVSGNKDILNFLPYSEKCLMETLVKK